MADKTYNRPVTKTVFVRSIPVELWRRVKAFAASNGRTLREVVIEAVTAHLSRHDRTR